MSLSSTELSTAIAAAASFVSDSRSPDGLWRDFETLAGESCDWVSGFVVYAAKTSGVLHSESHSALRALLVRQRNNGGWGYNESVPTDCDSTAWNLMASTTTTVRKPSMLIRAISYVLNHSQNSGFATYTLEDGIEKFIKTNKTQTKGWRMPHLCVTAIAVHALLLNGIFDERVRKAILYVQQAQSVKGHWSSYWWVGPAYTTAQTLRALVAARALTLDAWQRASRCLLTLQHNDGGFGSTEEQSEPFETAMSLIALLTRPDNACDYAIDRAARWLMDTQQGGRWCVSPILRIPRPMTTNPTDERYTQNALGTAVVISDYKGIFTAAAAISALAEYRMALQGRDCY